MLPHRGGRELKIRWEETQIASGRRRPRERDLLRTPRSIVGNLKQSRPQRHGDRREHQIHLALSPGRQRCRTCIRDDREIRRIRPSQAETREGHIDGADVAHLHALPRALAPDGDRAKREIAGRNLKRLRAQPTGQYEHTPTQSSQANPRLRRLPSREANSVSLPEAWDFYNGFPLSFVFEVLSLLLPHKLGHTHLKFINHPTVNHFPARLCLRPLSRLLHSSRIEEPMSTKCRAQQHNPNAAPSLTRACVPGAENSPLRHEHASQRNPSKTPIFSQFPGPRDAKDPPPYLRPTSSSRTLPHRTGLRSATIKAGFLEESR